MSRVAAGLDVLARRGLKTNVLFFDRQKVIRAMDDGTRRALSKFGAFVRTRARSSIRKRKAVSKPGNPPSSHTGLLKDFIFFVYEPNRRSVVIGPALFKSNRVNSLAALEYGGETTITDYGRRRGRRKRTVIGQRTVHIQARPFMRPAFHKELPKAATLWRNQAA